MPVDVQPGVGIAQPEPSGEPEKGKHPRGYTKRASREKLDPAQRAERAAAAKERQAENERKRKEWADKRAGRNGGATLEMLVGVEWTGERFELMRPEEFAWLSEARAVKLVADVLLLAALAGNINAARAWLDQYRWTKETKNGTKARGGSQVNVGVQLVIEDDLRSTPTVQMQRVKPGQIGSLKGKRCLPAGPITQEQPGKS